MLLLSQIVRLSFTNCRSDGRLASCVATLFYEPVINPPRCVALLLYALRIICVEAMLNELLYFWCYDRSFSLVGFPIPRNGISHPVFLDCVSGNPQNFSCCALAGYAFELQRTDAVDAINKELRIYIGFINDTGKKLPTIIAFEDILEIGVNIAYIGVRTPLARTFSPTFTH